MEAMVLFAVILVLIGAAFAIPNALVKSRSISSHDAPVVGATVLCLGLGGLNFVGLAWFAARGDINAGPLTFAVLPLIAGAIGVALVRRHRTDGTRALLLVLCAVLVLAGLVGYIAPLVSAVAATATALLFLAGLIRNLGSFLKSLDPRN